MIDEEVYDRLERISQKVVRDAKAELKATVSRFPVSGFTSMMILSAQG